MEANKRKNAKKKMHKMRKSAKKCLTKCEKVSIRFSTRHNTNMTTNIILQIPLSQYGPIATLAAAANMPLDSYVVEVAEKQEQSKMEGK